jgi:hypothetical protein
MADFNFMPPPPPYWWTQGAPPNAAPNGMSLEELERHAAYYKQFVERIEADVKKKKEKDDHGKKKGFTASETFWIMLALAPVIGWGVSGLYRASLLGIAHNIGLQ